MQIIQHSEHAEQVNDMHLTVLRKISILFRGGQMIEILFSRVQKQLCYGHTDSTNV